MIHKLISRTLGKVYDAYAMQLLVRERDEFVPWTSSAARPGTIVCVLNDIIINRRETIVEFGSGISTLLISRCLNSATHKLISFEHDLEWANVISKSLEDAGLSDVSEVIHAPLHRCEHSLDGSDWYDSDVVENSLKNHRVDTVLCDGPLATTPNSRLSRYPAIPMIANRLSDSYSIYLDDIDRRGERAIAKKWGTLLDISFQHQLLRGSFAVGTKGPHFNSLM